jgi:prevent-host-death family protein
MTIMSRSSTRRVPLAETKTRLAECVRAAEQGEEIVITRHGKAVAALVRMNDLELLRRLRAAEEGKGLAGLAGGWAGSDELVRLATGRRRTSRRRRPAA